MRPHFPVEYPLAGTMATGWRVAAGSFLCCNFRGDHAQYWPRIMQCPVQRPSLVLQIAQSRSCLYASGPNLSVAYMRGALGLRTPQQRSFNNCRPRTVLRLLSPGTTQTWPRQTANHMICGDRQSSLRTEWP